MVINHRLMGAIAIPLLALSLSACSGTSSGGSSAGGTQKDASGNSVDLSSASYKFCDISGKAPNTPELAKQAAIEICEFNVHPEAVTDPSQLDNMTTDQVAAFKGAWSSAKIDLASWDHVENSDKASLKAHFVFKDKKSSGIKYAMEVFSLEDGAWKMVDTTNAD